MADTSNTAVRKKGTTGKRSFFDRLGCVQIGRSKRVGNQAQEMESPGQHILFLGFRDAMDR